MRISSMLSLAGFILLLAGTFCPLLRPFFLFPWDVYKINQPYGLVLMLIAVIGIITAFLNQRKVIGIAAWLSFVLVALLFIGAVFKINTAFSFIPFPKLDKFLSKQIHLMWGWFVIFAGPILAIIGALSSKPKSVFVSNDAASTNEPVI